MGELRAAITRIISRRSTVFPPRFRFFIPNIRSDRLRHATHIPNSHFCHGVGIVKCHHSTPTSRSELNRYVEIFLRHTLFAHPLISLRAGRPTVISPVRMAVLAPLRAAEFVALGLRDASPH